MVFVVIVVGGCSCGRSTYFFDILLDDEGNIIFSIWTIDIVLRYRAPIEDTSGSEGFCFFFDEEVLVVAIVGTISESRS